MHTSFKAVTKFSLMSFIAIVWTAASSGQTTGASLSGNVHDQSGAALPGASVTITNVETGAQRALITDEDGRYTAP